MKLILALLAVCCLALAVYVNDIAQSAIHQIYAATLFLSFAVLAGAFTITEAIDRSRRATLAELEQHRALIVQPRSSSEVPIQAQPSLNEGWRKTLSGR